MASTSMFFIFIVVFTIFTLIVGAGLSFYQKTLIFQSPDYKSSGIDTVSMMMHQGTAVAVSLMFVASALLFLAASIKFVATNRN